MSHKKLQIVKALFIDKIPQSIEFLNPNGKNTIVYYDNIDNKWIASNKQIEAITEYFQVVAEKINQQNNEN